MNTNISGNNSHDELIREIYTYLDTINSYIECGDTDSEIPLLPVSKTQTIQGLLTLLYNTPYIYNTDPEKSTNIIFSIDKKMTNLGWELERNE
jgi:hypothetical protein